MTCTERDEYGCIESTSSVEALCFTCSRSILPGEIVVRDILAKPYCGVCAKKVRKIVDELEKEG